MVKNSKAGKINGVNLTCLPLQALIRKCPYGVISENDRCTTGLVCPLHVRGICLAIFPNLRKFEYYGT